MSGTEAVSRLLQDSKEMDYETALTSLLTLNLWEWGS